MKTELEQQTRDVILSISGIHTTYGEEPEQVELKTAGKLCRAEGGFDVRYEESELTGMEGSRTTLKIEPKQITMTRTGTYPSQMRFAEHKREVGLYQTEMGSVAVSTHTSKLTSSIDENGGALAIDYTVEIDANLAGAHQFELSVRPS